jgi:hypothetical protein
MTALVARLTTLAQVLHPRRGGLFGATFVIAAITGVVITQSSRISARALFGVIGLGGLAAVWTWGGFLLVAWFGPDTRVSPGFRPLAAIFLILWFSLGSIGFASFIWSVLFAGA